MKYRTLGRSNIEVSAIGMGCWAIGGAQWGKTDDEESLKALRRGLELGINFLDTADAYGKGHSEELISQVIAGRRDKIVLATKFGWHRWDGSGGNKHFSEFKTDRALVFEACERSLKRLKTDYIDLYQFHLPESPDGIEVREALEQLVKQGKIRWYGWSTDKLSMATVFAEGRHCATIQQQFNVLEGNEYLLELCVLKNLATLARGPLSRGLLTGKFSSDSQFGEGDQRLKWDLKNGKEAKVLGILESLRKVLSSNGRTLAQGALGWLLTRGSNIIPIPGFKNVKQIEENVAALNFDFFSKEQMEEIKTILDQRRDSVAAAS
jgi:aryl-alcohol dehydrogenase-like predicted oxidoreductase